jgi:AMMECR1 domain-containing protein
VTVRNGEALRGCLGSLDAQQRSFSDQLKQKIKDLADGKDSRFEQLSAQELPDLRYEVSVLMPPRLTSYESFYIHDGIILKKDGRSALYLPEVIVEAGWDKKTGLEQLSKKAGLDAHAWKIARLEAITSFLIR